MNLSRLFLKHESDFLFDLMSIDNFNNDNTKMRFWFRHAKQNAEMIEGDIFEFGVYRGNSLLSMALLLKKLNSNKIIYAFDTFSGFPSYSEFDSVEMFDKLYSDNVISEEHYERHKLLISLKTFLKEQSDVSTSNISSSGDFSENSVEALRNKISLLGLDNIKIVQGDFKNTLPKFFNKKNRKIFSANIDCDLYDGYKTVLPYIWNNLSIGGYVHLDEYYSLKFPGARIACNEFFQESGAVPQKNPVANTEFERWYFTK